MLLLFDDNQIDTSAGHRFLFLKLCFLKLNFFRTGRDHEEGKMAACFGDDLYSAMYQHSQVSCSTNHTVILILK